MSESLVLRGTLKGHNGWVTSLATTPEDPNLLLSSSRDKSVIVWQLTHSSEEYGYARRALRGHSHFVSDVVISSDGAFALSASWDSELRLWDIATGKTTRRFVGHDKDVLSVAFSVDNRQIVSGKCMDIGQNVTPDICASPPRYQLTPTSIRLFIFFLSRQAHAMAPSVCGTRSVNASTPSAVKPMGTPSGCPVYASPLLKMSP